MTPVVGRAIGIFRQTAEFSREEFAEQLELTEFELDQIESGKVVPSEEVISRAAVVLDLPVRVLQAFPKGRHIPELWEREVQEAKDADRLFGDVVDIVDDVDEWEE